MSTIKKDGSVNVTFKALNRVRVDFEKTVKTLHLELPIDINKLDELTYVKDEYEENESYVGMIYQTKIDKIDNLLNKLKSKNISILSFDESNKDVFLMKVLE